MTRLIANSLMMPSLAALLALIAVGDAAEREFASHAPLRSLPTSSDRPLGTGPAFFVDPAQGDDAAVGSKEKPWRSITHALQQVAAGDTLYLRGGTYYEHVYCAATGTADKPITIRSFAGETAVIDGAYREFYEKPAEMWEPFEAGSPGEFRSTVAYKNQRNMLGYFGDSLIGLQVYFYADDLRGARYVGPGIWYDPATGRIHARLAHYEAADLVRGRTLLTLQHLPHRLHHLQSYRGETDPRKLPLIIAPFRSVPLLIDGARHVRFQDFVVRGGGYDAVDIRHGVDLEFDNVTIYAGTYGLRARNTGPLKLHDSAIFGSVPPWSTRGETSLQEYPWRPDGKDLTRLGTHALLVPTSGDEYSVYYYPFNHLWEISHCEFADGHDGIYTGDVDGLKFHHNYVHNLQDDGVYLSSFRKITNPQRGPREIYQNVISGCLMAFAFGGNAHLSSDVHVYRNILDSSSAVSDHGGPPWESMRWYHNTILGSPDSLFNLRSLKLGQSWQVFNNLILSGKVTAGKPQDGAVWGGNFAGDPNFTKPGELRLSPKSPARDAGVPIPSDWPDPLRDRDPGSPDAGAVPFGEMLHVGRRGKLSF